MQNNNKDIWLPLLTSVGVGAVTYFAMTKNNANFSETMQKMAPIVASMGGNQLYQNTSRQNEDDQSGQLGPFGMS